MNAINAMKKTNKKTTSKKTRPQISPVINKYMYISSNIGDHFTRSISLMIRSRWRQLGQRFCSKRPPRHTIVKAANRPTNAKVPTYLVDSYYLPIGSITVIRSSYNNNNITFSLATENISAQKKVIDRSNGRRREVYIAITVWSMANFTSPCNWIHGHKQHRRNTPTSWLFKKKYGSLSKKLAMQYKVTRHNSTK